MQISREKLAELIPATYKSLKTRIFFLQLKIYLLENRKQFLYEFTSFIQLV